MNEELYKDRYGILHHKPVENGDPETSENGLLFSAVYLVMKKLYKNDEDITLRLAMWKCHVGGNCWRSTPISKMPSHLSHDNCLGIKTLLILDEMLFKSIHPEQITKEGGPAIIHPRDALIDSLLYKDWGQSIKLWALRMMTQLSSPLKGSSGPQLWWLRWHLLYLANIINKQQLNAILYDDMKDPAAYWSEVFWTYYLKDLEHPIVWTYDNLFKNSYTKLR